MSGDGVEDVEIPSVFMKKADALFLRELLTDNEVIISLTDYDSQSQTKEEEKQEKRDDREKKEEEKEAVVEKMMEGGVKEVEALSKHLNDLLEGLGTGTLTEELKNSVTKELLKLKTFNSEHSGADSAEKKKEDGDRGEATVSEDSCNSTSTSGDQTTHSDGG